jgi:DNA-binding MarR family transcriptional regulator
MLVIEQVPGIPQTRLIPFLQTDKANVTKLLQTMEKRGLIVRNADGDDQRNKVCQLTDQGASMTPKLNQILDLWESTCFQGIDRDELIEFKRINEIITRNLVNEWK